ncbi:MAG: ABC transporter ATP-binding protein [Actinomycetota bacterium]
MSGLMLVDTEEPGGGIPAPALELEELRVWYRTRRGMVKAVDGVSLAIQEGEALGLVGESGCGKSTLGRAVLGILPEVAEVHGTLRLSGMRLDGLDTEELRQLRGSRAALIFQEPMTRLDPLMSIEAHFREAIRAHLGGVSREQTRHMAAEALAAMGIPPTRLKNYPHEFSGGMRQRIMISLGLVLGPKVLIADEPTTALDVLVEANILRILEDLKTRKHMALLLITHNLGIIAQTCDRVAVMYAGRLAEIGPIQEIFARPRHPYAHGLLRSVIHLRTTELASIPGQPPDLLEPEAGCRFAPRCSHAMDVCRRSDPPRVEADGVSTWCFLYGGAEDEVGVPASREGFVL